MLLVLIMILTDGTPVMLNSFKKRLEGQVYLIEILVNGMYLMEHK